jgi:type IV secretory pathway VirB10-like protein
VRLRIGLLACAALAACGPSQSEGVTAELAEESAGLTIALPEAELAAPEAAPEEPGNSAAAEPALAPEVEPPAKAAEQPAPPPPPPAEKEADKAPPETEAVAEAAVPAPPPAGADEVEAVASGEAARMRLLPARPETSVAPWAGHIRRAGFACGSIASARQLQRPDGRALEIYKIDCSSGGSYQGTVKRGRLYFRTWTGRLDRR